jgi:hypothetical protein
MKSLNTDLGTTAERIKGERDDLLLQVTKCATEIALLHSEIAELRLEIAGLKGRLS